MPHPNYRTLPGRSSVALVVALVIAVAPGVARAQHDPRAVELFKQSAERYREGKFREAADLLREAYAREPEPLLLFNLGRACEGMGDAPCAIDAYTRFLATAKSTNDRGAIESRIATLRRQVEEKQRLEERAAHPGVIAAAPPPPGKPTPVPWIVAGAGVVGLGVGLGVGAAALHEHQTAVDDPEQKTKFLEQASAKSLAGTANAVLVVGALVAAGGLAWGIVDLSTHKKPSATGAPADRKITVRLSPATVSLVGRF
jgi:hypothetical protein